MRLRADIKDVLLFTQTIQVARNLQAKCILKFTEEKLHIICTPDTDDGVQVWSQLRTASLFKNYIVESLADNVITMVIPSEPLLEALQKAGSIMKQNPGFRPDLAVVKLSQYNRRPTLAIDIFYGPSDALRQVVTYHVPDIEIMKPGEGKKFTEPLCPAAYPDAYMFLPPLEELLVIVESLQPFSELLSFQANNKNKTKLVLGAYADGGLMKRKRIRCHTARLDSELPPPPDLRKLYSVLISTQSFLKFLNSTHLVSTNTIAYVFHQRALVLNVRFGNPKCEAEVERMWFYIPSNVDLDET